jgi:dTDP-4-amino-4,6-dideoxygalactose transaminase
MLGGSPAFPNGLPLTKVRLPDLPGLRRRLDIILESGILTEGAAGRELEERVAQRLGVPHVVAVSSCTTGLMLVLRALGATGQVVMPSFTFAATAHAAHWVGGTPVWAEVDRVSLTLDPSDAAHLVAGASALMATHVYGTPCQVERLQDVADAAGVPLVYDAAHGLGSMRRGRPVGSFGTAEVFSMSPTKVAVAGEGGLVATADEGLAEEVRLGRGYGNPGDYDCLFPGLNGRMSELHAAVALSSLASLDERVARRGEMVRLFHQVTAGLPGLSFPVVDEGDVSTYKDLTLIIDPERFGLGAAQLAVVLMSEGVDSRRYSHPPVHRQKAYASTPRERELPVTDEVADRVLTVPLWSHMAGETVRQVAELVVRLQARAPELGARLR